MEREYYKCSWGFGNFGNLGSGFFPRPQLRYIYFYEQSGTFYEFFTGYVLGVRAESNGPYTYPRIYSDEFGYTIALGGWASITHAEKMSSADFANEVKPFMPYRSKVEKLVKEEFQFWRKRQARALKDQAARAQAEARQQVQTEQNQRWLEDMLNNRH